MKNSRSLLALLALVIILLIAADLRLYHNSQTPGWYDDEGSLIEAAQKMAQGQVEYFGVRGSLMIVARQPLFIGLLALLYKFFPPGIETLRMLTGVMGVINVALIFFMLRKYEQALALMCALAYAIFPKAILYARFGFGYNMTAMLALGLFWAADRYLEDGKRSALAAAALLTGLNLLTEVAAVAFIPVLLIVVLWKRWRDIFLAIGLMLLPVAVSTLISLAVNPSAYWYDLRFTFSRTATSPLMQFIIILINAGTIHQDLTMLLGILGIILYPLPGLQRRLMLFLLLPLLITIRSVAFGDLGWYYLIPLFPFYAIGAGLAVWLFLRTMLSLSQDMFDRILARCGYSAAAGTASGRWLRLLRTASNLGFVILLLLAPLTLYLVNTQNQLQNNVLSTNMDWILLNIAEARQVADFVNAHVQPGDVVLASPALGWAIHANVTDYQLSLAYLGQKTIHFPADISHNRYRFDPSYTKARFIIVDNIWDNWAERSIPELARVREYAQQSTPIFQTEHIRVYQLGGATGLENKEP